MPLRSWRPYAAATLLVLAATVVEYFVGDSVVRQLSLVPLSLAIAASVLIGGFGPGVLAVCLAAIGMDLVVLEPGTIFQFQNPSAPIEYVVFIAAWLVFCLFASTFHRRRLADRDRRVHADREAMQADRIGQLNAALAQARTPAAAIEAALHESLHALGGDAGVLLLMTADGRRAEAARSIGYSPEAAAALAELTPGTAVSDAIGRGAPVFTGPADRRPGGGRVFRASVVVPLMIGSRVVALVELDFLKPRELTDADREYLDTLATRAAQALDRAWQFEYALRARAEAETQRARADQEIAERQTMELALRASEARGRALAARTSRLHGLTAALSEAVTLHAVARAVITQGRTAVGAISGDVRLLALDGTMFETIYGEGQGLSAEVGHRVAVEDGFCAAEAIRSLEPVFVTSFTDWQANYPKDASLAADGGYVSTATVPLLVEGAAIGVLAFYFTAPVNFDQEYRELLVSVAQDCAQALDRARLYESAQAARAEAEAANRLKDEFVSIVSHELRTPLNAILGWTAMLRRADADPAMTSRALQSVHDNAERQARLIDELLDFSRVTSGRLALEKDPVDTGDLLRGIVESMIPAAVAKHVTLEFLPETAASVTGDKARLEQVFFNLLGNAIKFTPEGGRVRVEVSEETERVVVTVTDTGLGIDPTFLPFVFERFRQSSDTSGREYGGLGLGLSIARQLVEAHGGSISVTSEGRGKGAAFTVTLPLAAPGHPAALTTLDSQAHH